MEHIFYGLFIFTGTLVMGYALLIGYYNYIWQKIPEGSSIAEKIIAARSISVTVIVPARNEALNIAHCIRCLLNQSYTSSLTQILIVDDFSTDETASIVDTFSDRVTLIRLSDHIGHETNSFKKKAIETAIRFSSGELIVCTDADCTMGTEWLSTIVSAYSDGHSEILAAPVKIATNGSALSVFQALDFISLQGITGAAVYKKLYPMCNGANLAYSRKAFEAVDGFSHINHIASGDDMLLMNKITRHFPGKSRYIKDGQAIVETEAAENIRTFIQQRIRWASKISHYKHPATFITLAGVYLLNLGMILLFAGCMYFGHWRWLLVLLAAKTVSEYFFVSRVASFFGQHSLMKYFPLCQPFHIIYTVVAGTFGSFGSYEWKNRKVN